MLTSIGYVRWNSEYSGSDCPRSISLAVAGSILESIIRMTVPLSSRPRRPARPLICVYSPELIHRNAPPSNFLACVNTTVLAGMFSPVENVSVANSTLISPSWNRISVSSFKIGNIPE